MALKSRRIGIFPGVFDPVHVGHVALALQALGVGRLDEIVFLPERQPRARIGVEHYAHRVAMLGRAIRPHSKLAVLELADRRLSVARTLPQLQALYLGHELVFVMGSDAVMKLGEWKYADRFISQVELLVGLRQADDILELQSTLDRLSVTARDIMVVDSYAPDVSSTVIRQAIGTGRPTQGLLASVLSYARQEWLYASPHLLTPGLPSGRRA